jgi:Uncharacterised nucleotidyltransferase
MTALSGTAALDLWPRVDVLLDRAKTVADLHYHRVHLYAAWRWRSLGRPIPDELVAYERGAAALRLALPVLAKRVREAYDGPIVMLKGVDVAALYPTPEVRPSLDLDLLVSDADGVQRALLDHGFVAEGPELPDEHHHLIGLAWPGLPGSVEVHSAPNWPVWLEPPSSEELIEAATRPSRAGAGFLALGPGHQALVLMAHLWRDDPRLGQLIDALLAAQSVDPGTFDDLARRNGLGRLWSTTQEVAGRLFSEDGGRVGRGRVWARSLEQMRQPTVLESRLGETVVPSYALPFRGAAVAATKTIAGWFRPEPNETWRSKLERSALTLRRSFASGAELSRQRAAESVRKRDRDVSRPAPRDGA